jgi:hypothetical protein
MLSALPARSAATSETAPIGRKRVWFLSFTPTLPGRLHKKIPKGSSQWLGPFFVLECLAVDEADC